MQKQVTFLSPKKTAQQQVTAIFPLPPKTPGGCGPGLAQGLKKKHNIFKTIRMLVISLVSVQSETDTILVYG